MDEQDQQQPSPAGDFKSDPRADTMVAVRTERDRAACRTLDQIDYTWTGGMLWKPPLGKCKPTTGVEIAVRLSHEYPTTEVPLILDIVIDTWRILAGEKTKFERKRDAAAAATTVGYARHFDGDGMQCRPISAAEFYKSPAQMRNAEPDFYDLDRAETEARETESLAHKVETLWREHTCSNSLASTEKNLHERIHDVAGVNAKRYDGIQVQLRETRKVAEGDRIEFRRAVERIVESIKNVAQGVESVRELNRQTNVRLTGVDAACASAWSSVTESVAGKGCELPAVPLVEQIAELTRNVNNHLLAGANVRQTRPRIPGVDTDP